MEAWAICEVCFCKLFSFDGNEDVLKPCPNREECNER